jgi:hypothetical protein
VPPNRRNCRCRRDMRIIMCVSILRAAVAFNVDGRLPWKSTSNSLWINRSPHELIHLSSCMNYYIRLPCPLLSNGTPHHHVKPSYGQPATVVKVSSTRSMFSFCYDMLDLLDLSYPVVHSYLPFLRIVLLPPKPLYPHVLLYVCPPSYPLHRFYQLSTNVFLTTFRSPLPRIISALYLCHPSPLSFCSRRSRSFIKYRVVVYMFLRWCSGHWYILYRELYCHLSVTPITDRSVRVRRCPVAFMTLSTLGSEREVNMM